MRCTKISWRGEELDLTTLPRKKIIVPGLPVIDCIDVRQLNPTDDETNLLHMAHNIYFEYELTVADARREIRRHGTLFCGFSLPNKHNVELYYAGNLLAKWENVDEVLFKECLPLQMIYLYLNLVIEEIDETATIKILYVRFSYHEEHQCINEMCGDENGIILDIDKRVSNFLYLKQGDLVPCNKKLFQKHLEES